MLLVIGAGVVLLMLPAGGGQDSSGREVQESGETEAFDLERFEEKLAQALSQVEGAGKARVVLTLEEGSRQVLARDREQDGARGTRTWCPSRPWPLSSGGRWWSAPAAGTPRCG